MKQRRLRLTLTHAPLEGSRGGCLSTVKECWLAAALQVVRVPLPILVFIARVHCYNGPLARHLDAAPFCLAPRAPPRGRRSPPPFLPSRMQAACTESSTDESERRHKILPDDHQHYFPTR